RILYVPPTAEKVDVLLKANGGAWDTGPLGHAASRMNCTLASYNGAGTLWLLGNRAEGLCGRHLVEGKAPDAAIVSVGNLITSHREADHLGGGSLQSLRVGRSERRRRQDEVPLDPLDPGRIASPQALLVSGRTLRAGGRPAAGSHAAGSDLGLARHDRRQGAA